MSGVWSTLQATLGATSQGTWVGWTVVSGQVRYSSEPAVGSSLSDRNTEGDRAANETVGESTDVSEGAREGGTGGSAENGEGAEEKDGESEGVGGGGSGGTVRTAGHFWYPFASSALPFPAILWHGRA